MKWIFSALWLLSLAGALALGYQLASEDRSVAPETPRAMEARLAQALEERDLLARAYLFSASLRELGPDNIDAAVAVLEAQRIGVTDAEVRLFMHAWCGFAPKRAFAWASAWQGPWRSTLEGAALFAFALRDPTAAQALLEEQNGARRQALHRSFVAGWARSGDAEGLGAYLFALPASRERSQAIGVLLAELIQRGPETVRSWAEAVPESAPHQARTTAFLMAGGSLAQNDPQHAKAFYEAHREFEYAQPALKTIARRWVDHHDPVALFAWLFELQESEARSEAVSAGFTRWWSQQPEAARVWLDAQTVSESLDPALVVLAREESRGAPLRALASADRITNESLRRRTLTPILRQWSRENRAATLAWMNAHDVPREIQREILGAPSVPGPAPTP